MLRRFAGAASAARVTADDACCSPARSDALEADEAVRRNQKPVAMRLSPAREAQAQRFMMGDDVPDAARRSLVGSRTSVGASISDWFQ